MDIIDSTINECYDELRIVLVSKIIPLLSSKFGSDSNFFLRSQQIDPDDILNDAILKFLQTVKRDEEYRNAKRFVMSSVMNISKQLIMNHVRKAKYRFRHQDEVKEFIQDQMSSKVDPILEFEFEDLISKMPPVRRTIARNIDEPNLRFKNLYGMHYRDVKTEYKILGRIAEELNE